MSEQDKEKIKKSIYYGFARLRILIWEIKLLSIEMSGLFKLQKDIADFAKDNIEPVMKHDLGVDDIFWKWSEQSSRYHLSGKAVNEIFKEKALQVEGVMKALKQDLKELGADVSGLPDFEFSAEKSEELNWDDIITGFEGASKDLDDKT